MQATGYVIYGTRRNLTSGQSPHILDFGYGTPDFYKDEDKDPCGFAGGRRAFLYGYELKHEHAYHTIDVMPCTQAILTGLRFEIGQINSLDRYDFYKPEDATRPILCTPAERMFELMGRPKNPSTVAATRAAQHLVPV